MHAMQAHATRFLLCMRALCLLVLNLSARLHTVPHCAGQHRKAGALGRSMTSRRGASA